MTTWRVDYTTPGFVHPDQPARCPDCEWTELRRLGQADSEYVLAHPCKEHTR